MLNIQNIAIAGTGNLAWHLAKNLKNKGFHVSGVWSRNQLHAREFADLFSIRAVTHIAELKDQADLIVIAVSDSAVDEVALHLGKFDGLVVHTAGSVELSVLSAYFTNCGVIYPLQTFSKNVELDLSVVPFFLECSSAEGLRLLHSFTEQISANVFETDSASRLRVHTAGVFASNYSNLMYSIAYELLRDQDLHSEILHPLIAETARKALEKDPFLVQTGPARRKDMAIIKKHLDSLADHPRYAEIYKLLADYIIHIYHE